MTTDGKPIKGVLTPEASRALALAIESAHRRDLVGGLIRYIKDGETDLGKLLFHYIHIEDYGQAMLEGWGDLHALLTAPKVGAMGLPYMELGSLVQEICASIVDREEFTKEQILAQIAKKDFDENYWWDSHGGRILDTFEEWIDLGETDSFEFVEEDA